MGTADDDTVRKLVRAASSRFLDARLLDRGDRRSAAIYFYGYAVEMWIKAAYFRMVFAATGLPPETQIDGQRRSSAVGEWKELGLATKPGPHNIEAWSRLLVRKRYALATAREGISRYESDFANDVIDQATSFYLSWREYIRYRSPSVRRSEVRSVRLSAEWFRTSYPEL